MKKEGKAKNKAEARRRHADFFAKAVLLERKNIFSIVRQKKSKEAHRNNLLSMIEKAVSEQLEVEWKKRFPRLKIHERIFLHTSMGRKKKVL